MFLLIAAPTNPELWKDLCHKECPMTYPAFCEVLRQVLGTTFKANPPRDGKYTWPLASVSHNYIDRLCVLESHDLCKSIVDVQTSLYTACV